jgi:SEC-C motif-containing protein
MSRHRECPCGSETAYGECCRPLHRGERNATTAEQLMRSRYAAFVEHDTAYLLRTWHPATRPTSLDLDAELRWIGLEIVASEAGGPDDVNGVVEFRAHHRRGGEAGVLHEASRFRRQQGEWLYVRGRIIGRAP